MKRSTLCIFLGLVICVCSFQLFLSYSVLSEDLDDDDVPPTSDPEGDVTNEELQNIVLSSSHKENTKRRWIIQRNGFVQICERVKTYRDVERLLFIWTKQLPEILAAGQHEDDVDDNVQQQLQIQQEKYGQHNAITEAFGVTSVKDCIIRVAEMNENDTKWKTAVDRHILQLLRVSAFSDVFVDNRISNILLQIIQRHMNFEDTNSDVNVIDNAVFVIHAMLTFPMLENRTKDLFFSDVRIRYRLIMDLIDLGIRVNDEDYIENALFLLCHFLSGRGNVTARRLYYETQVPHLVLDLVNVGLKIRTDTQAVNHLCNALLVLIRDTDRSSLCQQETNCTHFLNHLGMLASRDCDVAIRWLFLVEDVTRFEVPRVDWLWHSDLYWIVLEEIGKKCLNGEDPMEPEPLIKTLHKLAHLHTSTTTTTSKNRCVVMLSLLHIVPDIAMHRNPKLGKFKKTFTTELETKDSPLCV